MKIEIHNARTVFPAGAGMNRRKIEDQRRRAGVPRRRGDEPVFATGDHFIPQCSPQARG